eukprot:14163228-Heterocapsa_arctica.AAC.1
MTPLPEDERPWVMQVDAGPRSDTGKTLIMVDSGSFAHVCPRDFAKQFSLIPAKEKLAALTADGRPLVNYGEQCVEFVLRSGQH